MLDVHLFASRIFRDLYGCHYLAAGKRCGSHDRRREELADRDLPLVSNYHRVKSCESRACIGWGNRHTSAVQASVCFLEKLVSADGLADLVVERPVRNVFFLFLGAFCLVQSAFTEDLRASFRGHVSGSFQEVDGNILRRFPRTENSLYYSCRAVCRVTCRVYVLFLSLACLFIFEVYALLAADLFESCCVDSLSQSKDQAVSFYSIRFSFIRNYLELTRFVSRNRLHFLEFQFVYGVVRVLHSLLQRGQIHYLHAFFQSLVDLVFVGCQLIKRSAGQKRYFLRAHLDRAPAYVE